MKKETWIESDSCAVCGRYGTETHHIFYGTSNRKNSDQYGYTIPLCREHHTGPGGIHFNKEMDLYWKREAQKHFEGKYGMREDFMKIFGRSWL